MNTFKSFSLLALLLFFSGMVNAQNTLLGDVNKDGEVNITDVTLVMDLILNGQKELKLSESEVVLGIGNSSTVNVVSGYGSYVLTNTDDGIVELSLSGSTITITGKQVGSTVIKVTDTILEETVEFAIIVYDSSVSYLTCPDENHPHVIDLGLLSGTKWACCNVGTSTPEGKGNFYAWGETETKKTYSWNSYIHCNGTRGTCHNIGDDISGSQYDVAHVKWGDSWEMPSLYEIEELCNYCSSQYTILNGVQGRKITGINGGTIFLPSTYTYNSSSGYGQYWTSTVVDPWPYFSKVLEFDREGIDYSTGLYRCNGYVVRPVFKLEKNKKELILNKSEISLEVGNSSTIKIMSGYGSYIVESSDVDIVELSLNDTTITILGKQAGTAIVKVTDTTSECTLECSVTINNTSASYLTCPDDNHPHVIDLGLPSGTKWACCNVGANTPEGEGDYYAWGETKTKESYSVSNYLYYQIPGTDNYYPDLGSDISGTYFDVAHVKWGGSWVMPSSDQIQELLNNSTYEWITLNGVNGAKFIGYNGGAFFIPGIGFMDEYHCNYDDGYGLYWSSTLSPSWSGFAYRLNFDSHGAFWDNYNDYNYDSRFIGLAVRPVFR